MIRHQGIERVRISITRDFRCEHEYVESHDGKRVYTSTLPRYEPGRFELTLPTTHHLDWEFEKLFRDNLNFTGSEFRKIDLSLMSVGTSFQKGWSDYVICEKADSDITLQGVWVSEFTSNGFLARTGKIQFDNIFVIGKSKPALPDVLYVNGHKYRLVND